jgi:hypothetical protein
VSDTDPRNRKRSSRELFLAPDPIVEVSERGRFMVPALRAVLMPVNPVGSMPPTR